MQFGHVDRPRRPRPLDAAPAADGTASRSRAPSEPESTWCANPLIQAGRSHSSRARAADAMITTAAPSPTGAQSCARSGSATYGRASNSEAVTEPDTCAAGFPEAAARLRAATSAMSFSVHRPASRPSRACSAATDTESGHSGASRYGSSCSASTRRSSAPDDLPNP